MVKISILDSQPTRQFGTLDHHDIQMKNSTRDGGIKFNRKKATLKPKAVITKRKRVVSQPRSNFGPVSTIDTAPVSIGNSVQGASPVVVPTHDGVRIKGRDYLFGLDASATTITGWTLTGACPIAPQAMVASAIKGFVSSYAQYHVHGVAFHYITAATTSDAGSIAFYINKDRTGPGLPTSNSNFLPMLLSDHNSVLSPVWKNASALYIPAPRWYTTDVINDEALHEQCPGEVMVYSRITENVVPGYVLMDYDISFRTLQSNPKSTVFPIIRMKFNQVVVSISSAQSGGAVISWGLTTGTLLDGTTTSSAPTGIAVGDVYKFYLNIDDASFTTTTVSSTCKVRFAQDTVDQLITFTDGMVVYGVALTTSTFSMYPNYPSAVSDGWAQFVAQQSNTPTVRIPAYMSLVGSVFGSVLQSNI